MNEAFYIPVRRSLTQPILVGGVPRTVAIVGWTIVAALTLQLFAWWMPVVGAVLHGICAYFCQRDPHFFEIAVRAARMTSFYRS